MRYSQYKRESSANLLSVIQDIVQKQAIPKELPWLSSKIAGEVKIISLINSLQTPMNTKVLASHHRQVSQFCDTCQDEKLVKIIKIKLYCKVLQFCCIQDNIGLGTKYLNLLLLLLDYQVDIQSALYFIFGVKSLKKLRQYQLKQNKQFKFDRVTQAIFYYILSLVVPEKKAQMQQNFNQIYSSMEESNRLNKVITSIYQNIKYRKRQSFLREMILKLSQKEVTILNKEWNKYYKNDCQQIQNLIHQYQKQDKDIRQIAYLFELNEKEANYTLILKQFEECSLIKKMKGNQNVEIKPKMDPLQRINLYNDYLQSEGTGDLYKFQKCQQGMNLLKYNFGNDKISWRFVKLGHEGIYWGSDSSNCKLKASWQAITNLYYGKVTPNILQKCKYIESNTIFSLGQKERSIDFVCQSSRQASFWISAIAYILNKQWEKQSEKKIVITPGKILWKNIFMRLNLKSEVGSVTSKARAIGEKEEAVKVYLFERRKI